MKYAYEQALLEYLLLREACQHSQIWRFSVNIRSSVIAQSHRPQLCYSRGVYLEDSGGSDRTKGTPLACLILLLAA